MLNKIRAPNPWVGLLALNSYERNQISYQSREP